MLLSAPPRFVSMCLSSGEKEKRPVSVRFTTPPSPFPRPKGRECVFRSLIDRSAMRPVDWTWISRCSHFSAISLLVMMILLIGGKGCQAESSNITDTCQKLAVCALDRCISRFMTDLNEQEVIERLQLDLQVVPYLLRNANFACVLGPTCYDFCVKCESCKYAQEQIKRLILSEETERQCPNLERCAKTCLDDQVADPFGCVFKTRCAKHCLDNSDCPQCYDIVKRVFTGYCYRHGFIERFGQKCRPLFDKLASMFAVEANRRWL